MRDLTPRARWLCALRQEPRTRGTCATQTTFLRTLACSAFAGFVLVQSACPIVAAVSRFAPDSMLRASIDRAESGDQEECVPCHLAGGTDCWEAILRWIDAQFNGDSGVPFPNDECFAAENAGEEIV